MKLRILAAALATLPMVLMDSAWADSDTASNVHLNFSGFGTLGVAHNSNKDADFVNSQITPVGAGKSQTTSFGVDSKFGGQASMVFDHGLSAVLQVVADHRNDHSYDPQIEWANIKYDINKDWYVRAGRVVAPVFMYSEQRNVGYSMTALRMPFEVYSINPVTYLDGADIGGRLDIGGGVLSAQVTGGRHKLRLSAPTGTVGSIDISGSATTLNATYEIGAQTFRLGYGKYRVDVKGNEDVGTIFDLYESMVAAAGVAGTANVKLHNIDTKIWGLGYAYDSGSWLLQSEYVERKAPDVVIQDQSAWYVLGGYRFGKVLPYAVYSRLKNKEPAPHVLPASVTGLPALVINGVDASYNQHNEQNKIGIGLRYDFYKNVAFKAQYDRIRKPAEPAPNIGLFNNALPSFNANSQSVNVLSLNLDFVF